jgi:hypothetical protein
MLPACSYADTIADTTQELRWYNLIILSTLLSCRHTPPTFQGCCRGHTGVYTTYKHLPHTRQDRRWFVLNNHCLVQTTMMINNGN